MLPTRHQSLVDDLGSIVATSIDVDALLHDRVRPSAQCFADFVSAWLDRSLGLLAGGCCSHGGERYEAKRF